MRSLFSIIIIASILFACSKDQKFNKQINGSWSPVTLKISDSSGIGYYADATGIIQFNKTSKKSNTGTYSINIDYVLKGTPYTLIEEGEYSIAADKISRSSATGVENNSIIIYVNKEDFEFEIPNLNNERFQFVLKRN